MPDLFLVGASRKVLQTTFLGFPIDTPYRSINATPWICHPYASVSAGNKPGLQCASLADLEREFTGIDCSLFAHKQRDDSDTSNEGLLQKATNLLDWIKDRDERVVVGK